MIERSRWLARLKAEWLLLIFAALTVLLGLLDPRPPSDYQRWLNLPTLAGLLGLLLAIQGICDSGLVQRAAVKLVRHVHSLRGLGLLLVAASALLSTVLTNDVSLFLLVPLTVAIGGISNLPVLRMVILQALAVNAGSSLTPIGNPQNLLLWQHAELPFLHFVGAMLPISALMLGMVLLLSVLWLPRVRMQLDDAPLQQPPLAGRLGIGSILALLAMVLAMEFGQALPGALALLALFGWLARASAARLDWFLLATFGAIFLGLGHFAELPSVQHGLHALALDRPLALYTAGVLAAQVISNVPATVLLIGHTPDTLALAAAVNVGGFGLVTGSLANLIALRLARQPHALRQFHRVSLPFLLICAPLAYALWRLLH
jgi:Na+/H+ antiporter NhaD/arsenite permease-like protein